MIVQGLVEWHKYPVGLACQLVDLPRSSFYYKSRKVVESCLESNLKTVAGQFPTYGTRRITHLPEYKALWKQLREYPEFRRIASSVYPRGHPAPSFVFQIQHRELGCLTLRTATTVFTGVLNYSMVSYVPGDQQTLAIYRTHGWQSEENN